MTAVTRSWLNEPIVPPTFTIFVDSRSELSVVNTRARADLGWTPRYDFRAVLDALKVGQDPRSPLAQAIGAKGYHDKPTGVYTS